MGDNFRWMTKIVPFFSVGVCMFCENVFLWLFSTLCRWMSWQAKKKPKHSRSGILLRGKNDHTAKCSASHIFVLKFCNLIYFTYSPYGYIYIFFGFSAISFEAFFFYLKILTKKHGRDSVLLFLISDTFFLLQLFALFRLFFSNSHKAQWKYARFWFLLWFYNK